MYETGKTFSIKHVEFNDTRLSSAFHINIMQNVIADKMLKCSRDQENKTVNILKIVFKNEKIVMSPSCIVKRLKVLEHGKPPTTCFEAFK